MTRNSSLALAATAFTVTLALAWQALTVGANYHGDWTALFCTGDRFATPPALRSEHIYRFHSSLGYDGQFYHYIAHDPWQRRGFSAYIDAPLLRYTRILVPALASLLALGGDKRIDRSYVAAILLFTGLGSYWLGMYSAHFGGSPLWGISFLLVPAVLISLDRMVIDGSLAALSVGWAWYNTRERPITLWFVLAAAALARETGFILIAVQVLWLFRNSRYRASFGMAASAMPALMWRWYLARNLPATHLEAAHWIPFSGFVVRVLHPKIYPFPLPIVLMATFTDYLALTGVALAVVLVIRKASLGESTLNDFALYGFGLMAAFLFLPDSWTDVYGFGRTLTPFLLLLFLIFLSAGRWLYALPMLLVTPGILLIYGPQAYHVVFG